MNIRIARLDDAEELATVHVASWQSAYRGIIADDFLQKLSVEKRAVHWREALGDEASQEKVFVAEEDARHIIGFASGGPQRDPVLTAYDGELYAIYLLPTAQRQKVGSRLFHALANQLLRDGFTAMLIWVLAENPARKFYEALGGQFITEKPITIGEQDLIEVAYGWPDLRLLLDA